MINTWLKHSRAMSESCPCPKHASTYPTHVQHLYKSWLYQTQLLSEHVGQCQTRMLEHNIQFIAITWPNHLQNITKSSPQQHHHIATILQTHKILPFVEVSVSDLTLVLVLRGSGKDRLGTWVWHAVHPEGAAPKGYIFVILWGL